MSNVKLSPFVKWAGGKRQLLEQIKVRMPKEFNRYYEPFIGGGALLFELESKNAIINDINRSLINTYRQVANNPIEVIKVVKSIDENMWEDGKEYYYKQRELYNDKLMIDEYDLELAALFIFINKHCFNGLYRVNGKGLFNVPYNNSRSRSIDANLILAASKYLKSVTILEGDFQDACATASKGDFVFIDSPYAPLNPTSFELYTKDGFNRESHIRLAKLFKELTESGCYCMLTNHNTKFINDLYKDYKQEVIQVRRSINRDPNNRVGQEVIVTNY